MTMEYTPIKEESFVSEIEDQRQAEPIKIKKEVEEEFQEDLGVIVQNLPEVESDAEREASEEGQGTCKPVVQPPISAYNMDQSSQSSNSEPGLRILRQLLIRKEENIVPEVMYPVVQLAETCTTERPQPLKIGKGRAGQKDINKQSKMIIGNVYRFFKHLSENPQARANFNFGQVRRLTADACGVSERTVQRISKILNSADSDEERVFHSPRKSYKRESRLTKLNDYDKDVVRRTVLGFYDRSEIPTANKIRDELVERINYEGSVTSVLKILKSLGFRYKERDDGRKFLMERKDIIACRARFLRRMHSLRVVDGRPVVYLDETWISLHHSQYNIWHESHRNGGLKIPANLLDCCVVTHAGSAKTGFIPRAKLVFRGGRNAVNNYHVEMNGSIFRKWFVENLLYSLEEGCVIVMDNATYHSMQLNKPPTSNSRKRDIMEWLDKNGVEYNENETRNELLSRSEIKNYTRSYELDVLANEMGHEVVRLPPFHCQYNPIELIWAQIKRDIASQVKTLNMADFEKQVHQALDRVTQEDWLRCVKYAEELQESDYEKQCAIDEILEPIIIRLRESDDDSSNTDNEQASSSDD